MLIASDADFHGERFFGPFVVQTTAIVWTSLYSYEPQILDLKEV